MITKEELWKDYELLQDMEDSLCGYESEYDYIDQAMEHIGKASNAIFDEIQFLVTDEFFKKMRNEKKGAKK